MAGVYVDSFHAVAKGVARKRLSLGGLGSRKPGSVGKRWNETPDGYHRRMRKEDCYHKVL